MTLDELTTPHHGISFHLNWKPQEVDSVHNWKHNWKQNTTQCHLESQNYDLHIYCTEAKLTMYRNIDVKLSISVLISCEQCYQEKKVFKINFPSWDVTCIIHKNETPYFWKWFCIFSWFLFSTVESFIYIY